MPVKSGFQVREFACEKTLPGGMPRTATGRLVPEARSHGPARGHGPAEGSECCHAGQRRRSTAWGSALRGATWALPLLVVASGAAAADQCRAAEQTPALLFAGPATPLARLGVRNQRVAACHRRSLSAQISSTSGIESGAPLALRVGHGASDVLQTKRMASRSGDAGERIIARKSRARERDGGETEYMLGGEVGTQDDDSPRVSAEFTALCQVRTRSAPSLAARHAPPRATACYVRRPALPTGEGRAGGGHARSSAQRAG